MFLTCAPASTATGFAIAPGYLHQFYGCRWQRSLDEKHFPFFLNLPAPFRIFRHKSACTAFPVLRLTMYSLTVYLFTKPHIAECIKSFIWLSIIERNKNNPHGHSNTVAPVVNSIIGPCDTVVLFILLLTVSLAPQAPLLLLLAAFMAPSNAVAPVFNSPLVPQILLPLLLTASMTLQYCCNLLLLLTASLSSALLLLFFTASLAPTALLLTASQAPPMLLLLLLTALWPL